MMKFFVVCVFAGLLMTLCAHSTPPLEDQDQDQDQDQNEPSDDAPTTKTTASPVSDQIAVTTNSTSATPNTTVPLELDALQAVDVQHAFSSPAALAHARSQQHEDVIRVAEHSDAYWETHHHDLTEVERAWQKEAEVRRAAEEEHKLNMRLKQALADGRETLSQLQKEVNEIRRQEASDQARLASTVHDLQEREGQLSKLKDRAEEETRKNAQMDSENRHLHDQLNDNHNHEQDLQRSLSDSQKQLADKERDIKSLHEKLDALDDYRRKIAEEEENDRVEVTLAKEKTRQVAHEIEQEANAKILDAQQRAQKAEEEMKAAKTEAAAAKQRELTLKRKMEEMRNTTKTMISNMEEEANKEIEEAKQRLNEQMTEDRKKLEQDQYERKAKIYAKMMEKYNTIRNQYQSQALTPQFDTSALTAVYATATSGNTPTLSTTPTTPTLPAVVSSPQQKPPPLVSSAPPPVRLPLPIQLPLIVPISKR